MTSLVFPSVAAIVVTVPAPLNFSPIRPYLERVLSGHFLDLSKYEKEGKDNPLSKYSQKELDLFYLDLHDALLETFEHAARGDNFTLTAGGPASGKSKHLEDHIDPSFAYVDPDRTGLQKYMKRTHLDSIATMGPENAYNHWREASICLADFALAIGLNEGYKVAFGTTMTSPFASKALTSIRDVYHRSITMLHFTSPDDVRKATEYLRRAGGMVQCTDKDLEVKGKMLFDRLEDFVSICNRIEFLVRLEATKGPILAATWENSHLEVLNSDAFQVVKTEHDNRKGLGSFDAIRVKYTK